MIRLIQVIPSYTHEESLKNTYLDSFPEDERRDWMELMKLTRLPHFNLYSIINNNEPAGLITLWEWLEFTFIEHFAINESLQGKGIGSKVVKQLMNEGFSNIILETEEPTTVSAKRRIDFYSRLGFQLCAEEYYQPPYAKDKKAVKMLLMSYPEKITQSEFIEIKARLYKEVYQIDYTDF